MFNLAFLSLIRKAELEVFLSHINSPASLLEIGGGTGEQALALQKIGFQVVSIDLQTSNYTSSRCFPVIDYDGKHFPIGDKTVDIVFSSNVLEHISDLKTTHSETRRVLKKDGYAVHIMPSHTWRIATTVTHYCDLFLRIASESKKLFPRTLSLKSAFHSIFGQLKVLLGTIKWGIVPPRHGERGSVWSEASYFSPGWWKNHFEQNGLEVIKIQPMGLFYTGHMLLGSKVKISIRHKLANIFGSACYIYIVKPKNI
jgi:SAM-dependent methyltransferase